MNKDEIDRAVEEKIRRFRLAWYKDTEFDKMIVGRKDEFGSRNINLNNIREPFYSIIINYLRDIDHGPAECD